MLQILTNGRTWIFDPHKSITNYLNADYPTILSLLQRRANARNVSYTSKPTGEKHAISTFVDQIRIQLTRLRRKNRCFQN